MASGTKIPASRQYSKAEVELSTARRQGAQRVLVELKMLYLQLGELERAKIRVQLNQLRQ